VTRPEGAAFPRPSWNAQQRAAADDRRRRNAAAAQVRLNSQGVPMARCEFCRSDIIWCETLPNPNARTPEGRKPKLIPMDPEPETEDTGWAIWAMTIRPNLSNGLTQRPQVGEMKRNQANGYRARGGQTYVQHVKTCTHAEELRRGVQRRHQGKR
jgi:hypothetical protein